MAYILYVDEAYENKLKYTVLLGALVNIHDMFYLMEEIEEIKNKFEIKYFKDIQSKRIILRDEEKISLAEDIANTLDRYNIKLISSIIFEENSIKHRLFGMFRKVEVEDSYSLALYFILERAAILAELKKDAPIIVFADHLSNVKKEREFQNKFYKVLIKDKGSGNRKVLLKDIIYPIVMFIEDNLDPILEAIDLIISSLNAAVRYAIKQNGKGNFRTIIENLNNYNKYLKYYWKLLNRGPNGKVAGYGIKAFPI